MSKVLFAALFVAATSALPMNVVKDAAPVPPVPPMPSLCSVYNATDLCNADSCCNWCAVSVNATIGFCMPTLPIAPSPFLMCSKAVGDCKVHLDGTSCAGDGMCKWAPFGPPGTAAGICVYDWDRCKATPPSAPATPAAPVKDFKAEAKARIAKKAVEMAAPVPPGPTPKPKLNCTMIDEASCNAETCCEWCGNVFSPMGWCMPITGKPVPSLTCTKSPEGCESIKVEATCESYDLCAWLPIGPPGSGMGTCLFNWAKCAAPKGYGPEF